MQSSRHMGRGGVPVWYSRVWQDPESQPWCITLMSLSQVEALRTTQMTVCTVRAGWLVDPETTLPKPHSEFQETEAGH